MHCLKILPPTGSSWERRQQQQTGTIDTLEVRVLAPTSKGRKERVVPIAPELGELLTDWKKSSRPARDSEEVLPWPYDGYRPLYDDWHAIQKAAGVPEGQHYVPKNCR